MPTITLHLHEQSGRMCVLLGEPVMDGGEMWQKVEIVEYEERNGFITHIERELHPLADNQFTAIDQVTVRGNVYPSRGY